MRTTTNLASVVLGQTEERRRRRGSKLQERLSRFGAHLPGQEDVSPATMADVNELVDWLISQSADNVSATVSGDGLLSVAAVLPNDMRLYVEVERDGSVEAAVTRDRRYATEISGNTVADLTPEVILAAVTSISSRTLLAENARCVEPQE